MEKKWFELFGIDGKLYNLFMYERDFEDINFEYKKGFLVLSIDVFYRKNYEPFEHWCTSEIELIRYHDDFEETKTLIFKYKILRDHK